MASDAEKVDSKTNPDKKPVVPRTALELQRMQYEKLMKDPVRRLLSLLRVFIMKNLEINTA